MKFIFCLMLCFIGTLFSQDGFNILKHLQVAGFHSQGVDPKGELNWTLDGEQAEVKKNVTYLQKFKVKLAPAEGKSYALNSTSCQFMHTLQEIKSNAPIWVSSEGLEASGLGYDIYLNSKIVRIRSAVQIRIKVRGYHYTWQKDTQEKKGK